MGNALKNSGQPNTECGICFGETGNSHRPSVQEARVFRRKSVTHPLWGAALVALIKDAAKNAPEHKLYFRWHDTGDIQSLDHLLKIVWIVEQVPKVKFWLQTKEIGDISKYLCERGDFPSNLTVRLSSTFIGQPQRRLGLPGSYIIPDGAEPVEGSLPCPASAPGSLGHCAACRECWKRDRALVGFHQHG